ncbi:NAD(P)H-binding protein [Sulfitobacter sp. TSTF-M16]|uniref:Divinyl chlorophyllide a 8-vinyl-reductase, chloroplastic n=2 Tax=Sulfitobacter aestuariivivens TaxID=2766981 RepID=A0A927D1H5_9RHOB|nr:NAD(P)H-binding protein [Sulfitobacter aestuariivivens]
MLLGGTGTAGRAAALRLRDEGYPVIAAGRRDPAVPGVRFVALDITDRAAATKAMIAHRVRGVLSCLASRTGVPQDAWAIDYDAHVTILGASEAAGVENFVLLSAICVQKPRLAFQHAKLAFEAALAASSLTHTIVRPTALFKSLSGQVGRVQAGRPYVVFEDGKLTACKPISDRDLAAYLVSCLQDTTRQSRTLPIGGPGPALTPLDMGNRLFELTGQPQKFRHVPIGLLSGIESALRVGGRILPPLRAKAALAQIGKYYATESMLVWDPESRRYDADATPEFGSDRLFDHYESLINGTATPERGDHAVF